MCDSLKIPAGACRKTLQFEIVSMVSVTGMHLSENTLFFTGQWLNLFYGTLTAAVAPANDRLLQHTNHKLMFYDETKK